MREIQTCPGGYPYVKHNGPARVVAIVVTPRTIGSDCYCELLDVASTDATDSTSLDSTAPRNLEHCNPCRKPFRVRQHADIGTKLYSFEPALDFDKGVHIGYAENCWVRVYIE